MLPVADAPVDSGADLGSTGAGDGDLWSAVGEALNTPEAPEDGQVQAEGATELSDQVPDGQAAADGEAPSPYQLSPDGSGYVVPKADFASLSGFKTYATEVQNYFPTSADAKASYEAANDYRAMFHDFRYGSDQDVDAFLGMLAGDNTENPQARAEFQQSFARMMTRAPEMLRRVNGQAYEQLADRVMQSNIQAAYQAAGSSGQPQDLEYAQRLDWGWNGKYQQEVQRHDLNAQAMNQLQEREQALATREKAIQDSAWGGFDKDQVNGPKWKGFYAEIDKALEPVKSKHDPLVFDAIRDRVRLDLVKKLDGDSEWAGNHIREWKAIEATFRKYGDTPALRQRVQIYNNDFSSRMRRYIGPIAAPLLSQAAKNRVQNAATQAQTAPANARTSAPNAQPPRTTNGQFTTRADRLSAEVAKIFQ